MIKEHKKCRICGNTHLTPVIDLGDQPLSGVFPKKEQADPSKSPLQVVRCDTSFQSSACGLVQLLHTADLTEMYGQTYGYYSAISPSMVRHLSAKVKELKQFANPSRGDIGLDIGCNDGTLLNEYGKDSSLVRVGIDPSSEKFADRFQSDIKIVFDFFSEKSVRPIIGNSQCKIITSIAMFYDLDDPIDFIKQISSLLSTDGVWALELSYFPLLLSQLTYDQICHEHVTYLGLRELDWMFKRAGLKTLDVFFNDMNGGSIYLYVGHADGPYKPNNKKIQDVLDSEKILGNDAPLKRFENRVQSHRDEVLHFFDLARAAKKTIYGYGASTKGNIVLNYCGITTEDLIAIGDKNPEKDGLVTPGTRIPIISHDELRNIKPDYLFVLIWHFRHEVISDEIEYLKGGGKMIFSLPRLHVVDINNYERFLDAAFEDLAFSI